MNILPIGIQTANVAKLNKTSFTGAPAKAVQNVLVENPELSERMITALQNDIKARLNVEIPREYFNFSWQPVQKSAIESDKFINIGSFTEMREFYNNKGKCVGRCTYNKCNKPFVESEYVSLNKITNYYIDNNRTFLIEKFYANPDEDQVTDITIGTTSMFPLQHLRYTVRHPDEVYRIERRKGVGLFGGDEDVPVALK